MSLEKGFVAKMAERNTREPPAAKKVLRPALTSRNHGQSFFEEEETRATTRPHVNSYFLFLTSHESVFLLKAASPANPKESEADRALELLHNPASDAL
jgi:hypothetical protein